MDYLDFELCIGKGEGRLYPLTVVRSPAGEQRATMQFPFDELELANKLQTLQIALLKSGSTRRDLVQPEEQTSVRDFGRVLFEAALPDEVRSCYRISREKALAAGKGLRVRLRFEAPDLAALPWEFLYDEAEGDFICLSKETPIVRYLELDRPPAPIAIEPPLRILGMIAAPQDRSQLDVAHERQRMQEAIGDLEARGLVTLTWLEGQTWRDLQRCMRQGPWHVFHFVGHGGFDAVSGEGMLALAGDDGNTFRLPATQLGRLLADHRSLRLAVLNACEGAQGNTTDIFSSTASVLIRRGIPAVVAMQYEITDRAAIEFGRVFYESIAEGLPVDAAVAEARKSISLSVSNTVEWGTPVLHMRAPDGRLFDIDAVRAMPPAAAAPPGGDGAPAAAPPGIHPLAAVPAAMTVTDDEVAVRIPRKTLSWSLGGALAVIGLVVVAFFVLKKPSGPDEPSRLTSLVDLSSLEEPLIPIIGRVMLNLTAETLGVGQGMHVGVSLIDSLGNGMNERQERPSVLEWSADPPDRVRITPDSVGLGATVYAEAPGMVTLTASVAHDIDSTPPADAKIIAVLASDAQRNAALVRYFEAGFNDASVPNARVLAAYEALSLADRRALEDAGQVTGAALDSITARLRDVIALFGETQRAATSDTLTLAEKRVRWLAYRSRADSLRNSPSTGAALAAVARLDSTMRRHVDVESLVLCRASELTCSPGNVATTFRAGSSVYVSFQQKPPTSGRSQALTWRWIGPGGTVVHTETSNMGGLSRTRRLLPGTKTGQPGPYEVRLFNAGGDLIGRQRFRVAD